MTATIRLVSLEHRNRARAMVRNAPDGHIVRVSPPTRTLDQNARMWAMLSDVSRAEPDGRQATPETWKALFMHACGHAIRFEMGLDGQPFPAGFHSSKLTVRQMSELIAFVDAWGTGRGVEWSEPNPYERVCR